MGNSAGATSAAANDQISDKAEQAGVVGNGLDQRGVSDASRDSLGWQHSNHRASTLLLDTEPMIQGASQPHENRSQLSRN
jgi:hypothetical protein